MVITTVQKLIEIGSSRGVTLPAKDLKALRVKDGEELEVIVRKKNAKASDTEAVSVANDLLRRYKTDFTQLAKQ